MPDSHSAIHNAPDDRTVFLNKTASFTCFTQLSYTPHWRVNDTDYIDNTIPIELQDDLNITSGPSVGLFGLRLTIIAREIYNETRIVCVAGNEVSDTATLYIQGINQVAAC